MRVVESAQEISKTFAALRSQLEKSARSVSEHPVARAGTGTLATTVYVLDQHLWIALERHRDCYLCLLGVGDPLESSRAVVEVNTASSGRGFRFGGWILDDADGQRWLARGSSLSGRSDWARFLEIHDSQTAEVDGQRVVVLGRVDSPEIVRGLSEFAHRWSAYRQSEATRPQGNSWRDHLWALFRERAEAAGTDVALRLYWRGNSERAVEAVLPENGLEVRVTPEMIAALDEVPTSFVDKLTGRSPQAWRRAVEAVRSSLGQTVSLNKYGTAYCTPLYDPDRTTVALNVYERFQVAPDELVERGLLLPEERLDLAEAFGEGATVQIARLGHALQKLHQGSELTGLESESTASLADDESSSDDDPSWGRNVIFFGPPGTGKSFLLADLVKTRLAAKHVIRVTFHPEYSYFDFVGSYRPAVGWLKTAQPGGFVDADGVARDAEPRSYYRFEPGPLSQAIVQAAREPGERTVLVIEEINRGNCAAIFGEVFQLLDRIRDGKRAEKRGLALGASEYAIRPSSEHAAWLARELPEENQAFVREPASLRLPPNLYLYATMNTSDQSLFPMDTAFRRRWGMHFVGIERNLGVRTQAPLHAHDRVGVPWLSLMSALNKRIVRHTHSDDKQMGPYFVRPGADSQRVASDDLCAKVIFYLWADVFRDQPGAVFDDKLSTYEAVVGAFRNGRHVFAPDLLAELKVVTPTNAAAESLTPSAAALAGDAAPTTPGAAPHPTATAPAAPTPSPDPAASADPAQGDPPA